MPAFSVAVPDIEAALLDDVSVAVGWSLIEHFATLVRESGMPAEHAAADYVVARLAELGIDYEVFEPPLYLSLPRGGSVRLHGREGESFRAKPPAFAASTTGDGVTAGNHRGTPAFRRYPHRSGDIGGGVVSLQTSRGDHPRQVGRVRVSAWSL